MEKVAIIKNVIDWAILSPEECLALVKDLIAENGLKQEDCFEETRKISCEQVVEPEPTVDDAVEKVTSVTNGAETTKGNSIPPKKCGRPKKEIGVKVTQPLLNDAQPKRRGRPRKVQSTTEANLNNKPLSVNDGAGRISDGDKRLIEQCAKIDTKRLLDDEVEMVGVSTPAELPKASSFGYLADYPELKSHVLGKKQSFYFVYKWKGHRVLSLYVLSDLMPEGIYIPYKVLMFGKYKGFIVSFYDEHVITNAVDAMNEAERTMEPVGDEVWMVMNSIQWATLKNVRDCVNRMLISVGGDILQRLYMIKDPRMQMFFGSGSIRYTVEVKDV